MHFAAVQLPPGYASCTVSPGVWPPNPPQANAFDDQHSLRASGSPPAHFVNQAQKKKVTRAVTKDLLVRWVFLLVEASVCTPSFSICSDVVSLDLVKVCLTMSYVLRLLRAMCVQERQIKREREKEREGERERKRMCDQEPSSRCFIRAAAILVCRCFYFFISRLTKICPSRLDALLDIQVTSSPSSLQTGCERSSRRHSRALGRTGLGA